MNEAWAIVELMGHVRVAGRVSEEERFGVKIGRIDIPQADGSFVTQHFGGGSVYRITYVGEAEARAVALANRPQPVHSWEMPRALPPAAVQRIIDNCPDGQIVSFAQDGQCEDDGPDNGVVFEEDDDEPLDPTDTLPPEGTPIGLQTPPF